MSDYEPVIGLETHVQLGTSSKLFCGCATDFAAPPNSQVCPVCLGYPGSLPVPNEVAIEYTVRAGLMLGCDINLFSKFDRKSYFYPDMPKNYQISQYDMPLCLGGAVEIEVNGEPRLVQLRRIHLEEDTGKNVHFDRTSGVDFNRAGMPLMEIVSEPDIYSADESMAYLHALKQSMLYAGVSECNLEQGNFRCDVNCSVRPVGSEGLGTKTELKNLNTFKGIHAALSFEIGRQLDIVRNGGEIQQETRRWDVDAGVTASMRTKEDAYDYRYFPDPDLAPIVLAQEHVDRWRDDLPEAPRVRRARMIEQYDIPEYDAGILAADKAVADFYEEAARAAVNPKAVSNWIMTEMLRLLSENEMEIADSQVTPGALAELVGLVEDKTLNSNSAKEVFGTLFKEGGRPGDIVEAQGLRQVSDERLLDQFVDQAIADNPESATDYRNGKTKALQFLMGQVMRLSKGKADPQAVQELLRTKLGG